MTKPAIINTAISRCEEHGTFENSLVESFIGDAQWQGCPRCHFDARHSADASVATAARDVQFARQLNADLLASGIPLRFRVATLENYRTGSKPEPQAVALRQCREYAEGFAQHWQVGLSMMLLGEVGTGKTHLGCAVAQHVIRHHGAHVRYTSALAIIRDVKATFSKTASSTEHQVFGALQVPDLLVIDEIGVQHGSCCR
jgi:DNA replication protein DnaC